MRQFTAVVWVASLLNWRRAVVLSEPAGASFQRRPAQQLPSLASDRSVAAGSAIQCALLCLGFPTCLSANFRPADGTGSATGSGSCDLREEQGGALQPAAGAVALQLPGSCRQLQQLGHRADGVYRQRGLPAPLYCDMTLTLGGGWTLLVAFTATDGWSVDSVMERNSDTPTISDNYSILRIGDQIRDLASSPHFRYRLEGNGRERWGGVWQAARHLTLNSSHSDQTDVTLELQFDSWTPSHYSILNIVPWINRESTMGGNPILSTCSEANTLWFGTIVTAINHPTGVSPWIHTDAARTGARLYWVRED